MIKKKHILRNTPKDRYCKEILSKAVEADILLNMRDWQLEDKWWRNRVKSNLLDAKPIINECFAIFRKMVMEGYNESRPGDKDKLEKIRKGFTAIRKAITKAEVGGSGGPSKGMLNKTTYPMVVKRYRNLLKVILHQLVIESIKDAGSKTTEEDDFYKALFNKTYDWTGSTIFRIWGREKEKPEEAEEGEIEEGIDVGDEFVEQVGEIT